jgi:predicted DNA-binding transcriptional regulator AlpA
MRQVVKKFLRFADLRKMGLIRNWTTLQRWIATEGFPRGFMAGKNSRLWDEDEVMTWVADRPAAKGGE